MKITFLGAAHEVTGSCTYIQVGDKKGIVDCGMEQGRDLFENEALPVPAGELDFALLTHAHIDHSGHLPLLYKQGFRGSVYATAATCSLCDIMLRDSANIQMSEAEWKSRKSLRNGGPEVEPLYDLEDVAGLMSHMIPCPYGKVVQVNDCVTVRFTDVGHLLGSAAIEVWLTENGQTRKICFSGDLGNLNQPILRDPQPVKDAQYLVIESTYGDRNHSKERVDYVSALASRIQATLDKGGNLVIPSFAVGRTQELLYFIREIKDKGLVTSVKDFPVYVDSPLAKKATTIFCGDLRGYLDNDALALVQDGTHMFNFPGLHLTETVDESKLLNMDKTPKVIISASGMCDAGRIRHHLKYNLWRADSAVVFVGFQSPGTLGRNLLDGAESVRLFGEDIAVRAKIVNFQGLSSHADHDHLIDWIKHFDPARTTHVFVVHGDRDVAPVYADTVKSLGFAAHAPQYTEEYDLIADKQLSPGYLPERRTRAYEGAPKTTGAYQRLVQLGDMLVGLIRRSKGRDNKTLAAFAEAISKLISKFEF